MPDLGQPDPDELEHVLALFAAGQVGDLVGVQFDVDHPHEPPLVVDHGQGQEAMENEELARIQERGRCRKRDHVRIGKSGDRSFRRIQEQSPRGEHSHQPVLLVDHIEVHDPPLPAATLNAPEGLGHGVAHRKPNEILAHVLRHRVVEAMV
ncbi:MAG: hypothetical protein NUV77_10965 [Thermoguttaceae bacterium]|nr:hypothetical protein [Thermoguttaceae bacterium]